MSIIDEQRLLTKISSLYYIDGVKQSDIASELGLSQSFVSRSLKKSQEEGIVKISVVSPPNIFLDLEKAIQKKFNISQVIVVDAGTDSDDTKIKTAIGSAAAYYLQTTLKPDDLVGVSAWSGTIAHMLDNMPQLNIKARGIVQLLGGVGINGNVQANLLTYELSKRLNCVSYVLPSQSLMGGLDDLEYKNNLINTPEVFSVVKLFNEVNVAVVGIGTLTPSKSLQNSGLYYNSSMMQHLADLGAVGDICLHYYNQKGEPILEEDNDPIIGMELNQLKSCPKVIALAGGLDKKESIKAALIGGYIDVLIIDLATAERLL